MKNVSMTMDGKILVIKVDTAQTFGPSSSGKSTVIASTEGNQAMQDFKVGLNVYRSIK